MLTHHAYRGAVGITVVATVVSWLSLEWAHGGQALELLYSVYRSSDVSEERRGAIRDMIGIQEDAEAMMRGREGVSALGAIQPQPAEVGQPVANDGVFAVRKLSCFPNPAKRQNPTIRVIAGPADSVEIRVRDASGREAYRVQIDTPRTAQDGARLESVFDHVLESGRFQSGVYSVVAIARKAGHADIKQSRKCAILK